MPENPSGTDGEARAGPGASDDLLQRLGERVRGLRRARGWSREALSERSGISVRFLARIESGAGNLSILRLGALSRALGTTPADLLRRGPDRSRIVSLVGVRGAGKSTVGPLLAERLGTTFVELDERIVETSGLTLDELFELHGEAYYRTLEAEALRRILADERPAVVALGGGVVNTPATWEMLRRGSTVVWLRASADRHWNRVVAQGDRRPMADNPAAMEELRRLLRAREGLYAEADATVDTSDLPPAAVARKIGELLALLARGRSREPGCAMLGP